MIRRDIGLNLQLRHVFIILVASCFHVRVSSFLRPLRFSLQRHETSFAAPPSLLLPTTRASQLSASEVSDVIETNLAPPSSTAVDELSSVVSQLEQAWRASLIGNFTQMKSIVSSDCQWQNPFMQDMADFYENMASFAELFLEPRLTIFNRREEASNKHILDYQLSFTYPMPWRPRIIIPGRAEILIDANKRVSEVKEIWRVSLLEIFTKQFFPRWWDIWHVFSSPSPEYPPMKLVGKQATVSFMEVESTVVCDVMWTGLAKYFGPPLAVVPGFSLFGELKTSKPKPDRFLTVLPVDVASGKYVNQTTGEGMKRSIWSFHVPSALQELVIDKCSAEDPWVRINYSDMTDGDSDEEEESGSGEGDSEGEGSGESEKPSITPDFVRDLEQRPDVKSRIMNLYSRGDNITFDQEAIAEYASNERIQYRYRIRPRRLLAAVDLQGEVNAKMITSAIDQIRDAVAKQRDSLVPGKRVEIVRDETDLSLQLCYTKCCFNLKAEPAMAIYESQYKYRKSRVYLELRAQDLQ
jgi:hypothetical protein